jgi:hypothetical protein
LGIIDLETAYSDQNYLDVATKDDVRVGQTATGQYAIHQFKDYVGGLSSTVIHCELQTNCPPSLSTVYLQIFNRNTPAWQTVDTDNSSSEDTDFILTANIPDLTDYKDASGVIVCRVYQLAI